MSGTFLFLAADPRECHPFVANWARLERAELPVHWARSGSWKSRRVLAIANGAGPARARMAVEAAASAGRLEGVCSIGFCGALDPELGIGDIFVASAVNGEFPAALPAGMPPARRGALASVPRIAGTAAEKAELGRSGARVVEMEAAGAARAAAALGVPFYCIRAVSDLANEDFSLDFNDFLMPDGRFHTPRLILGALARPARFAELIRLSKRTRTASKNLGDFLAHCDF